MTDAEYFVRESNRIEGILRDPTQQEMSEFRRFMDLEFVTLGNLQQFVSTYQPGAVLRDRVGLNVRVGNHIALAGGPDIVTNLGKILYAVNDGGLLTPFEAHVQYETLHPFTDGNGRSGRMIWAWQVRDISLGFLHRFYYQTLEHQKDITDDR